MPFPCKTECGENFEIVEMVDHGLAISQARTELLHSRIRPISRLTVKTPLVCVVIVL